MIKINIRKTVALAALLITLTSLSSCKTCNCPAYDQVPAIGSANLALQVAFRLAIPLYI